MANRYARIFDAGGKVQGLALLAAINHILTFLQGLAAPQVREEEASKAS